MKTLLIIRHAKAESAFTLNDFERPLNERGKKDVPVMAAKVKARGIHIDAFVSSPAKRAKKTAELFCEAVDQNKDHILFISALYHAPAPVFFEVIKDLDSSIETAAVFSHNPGITQFVNMLTGSVQVDNVPTCGIFAVQANCSSWKDFEKTKKEFLFFDYPKSGN